MYLNSNQDYVSNDDEKDRFDGLVILRPFVQSALEFIRLTAFVVDDLELFERHTFTVRLSVLWSNKHKRYSLNLRSINMKPYGRFLPRPLCVVGRAEQGGGINVVKSRHFKTELIKMKNNEIVKDNTSKTWPLLASDTTEKKRKNRCRESIRPNYFVAVPIINEQIKEKLKEVQKSLVESNKKLESALVSLQKTHITLAVMHLKNAEEIERASNGLKSAILRMQQEGISEMTLNFDGLDHFRNEVVFARVSEDQGFAKLCQTAEIVRNAFSDCGVTLTDDRAFKAHVTVAKLSKDRKLKFRGLRKIDERFYENFRSVSFGQELCSKLQLLSMMKTDKVTGYYGCVSELAFAKMAVSTPEVF